MAERDRCASILGLGFANPNAISRCAYPELDSTIMVVQESKDGNGSNAAVSTGRAKMSPPVDALRRPSEPVDGPGIEAIAGLIKNGQWIIRCDRYCEDAERPPWSVAQLARMRLLSALAKIYPSNQNG